MKNLKLVFLLYAFSLSPGAEAESVFGQGGQWNLDFAANALSEFNALETDTEWVTTLQNLPDNTWVKANPSGIPVLPSRFRSEVPMVYMPQFKAMFFTAGDGEELGSYNSDSWTYSLSANTWVQMWPNYIRNYDNNLEPYPQDRPAARCSLGLGFDTDRGKLVLRGGANTGSQGLYTWEYDLATNAWERTAERENGYPMSFDNNLGFIPGLGAVEVGGNRNTPTGGTETWVYHSDISGWVKITTNGAPPGANNSRLVWAAKQQRLIFFTASAQLWAFDPVTSTWENISPTSGPSPGQFGRQGMAYDLANDVVIMYGNDPTGLLIPGPWVYSFVDRTWRDMNPDFRPADGGFGRQQSQHMAYDIEHNVVVITGNGRGTWVYRYKNAGPSIEMPVISPNAGAYELSVLVTIASETPGATIRYTIDGTVPTLSSALYSEPILLTTSATVRAIAFQNELSSVMASSNYIINGPDLTPPTIVSAAAPDVATQINIVFSETVTVTSAQTTTNYQIDQGIDVFSASLNADNRTVQLQTAALTPDRVYTVTVNNIRDTSSNANEIAVNSSVDIIFSPVMNFDNGFLPFGWIPLTEARWSVVNESGDNALFLNTSAYDPLPGLRLGEHITSPESYSDFSLSAEVKTNESAGNPNADYALVFGFQDDENYYYMLFNRTMSNAQLFLVVDGVRQEIATVTESLLIDDEYHDVEVRRLGDAIEVRFDNTVVLQVVDSTFLTGKVGLGSYNDSAYFDNIRITDAGMVDLIFSNTFE